MRRCRLAPLVIFAATVALGGCWSPVTDLVESHVSPGGTISASLDSAPALTTKGLADSTKTPMTLEGTSAALVVGLVIGTDEVSGIDGKTQLLAGDAVSLSVSATSTTQISVYLGGTSCVTTAAVIHLVPASGKVTGDFAGSGPNDCETSGTFTNIPIYEGD